MPVDTEAGAPPEAETKSGPDGSGSSAENRMNKPTKEAGRIMANSLISSKFQEIADKYQEADGNINPDEMSPREKNLFAVAQYRVGFTDEEYAGAGKEGKVLNGGLEVTTTDGRTITITSLLSEKPEGGEDEVKIIYTARTDVDDPDKPGQKLEVTVDAGEVVRSHMAKTADSITDNFTDPAERKGIEWYASGSTDDPPEGFVQEEKVAKLIDVTDTVIKKARTDIQLDVNILKNKGKLNPEDQKTLTQKELLIGHFKLLEQVVEGEEDFAELARFSALQALIDSGSKIEGLTELQELLKPDAEKGLQALQTLLINEGGATNADLKLIEDLGFGALMDDPKLVEKIMKIQGLDRMLFGREIPNDEIMSMLGGTLNEAQRKWLDDAIKTGKVGGGILAVLLLALAAIPAAALYAGLQGQKR